jgi:uncharacterized damage-inducible protein DinB
METKAHPTDVQSLVKDVQAMKLFFDRSTKCLDESDASFAPKPEMFTVAGQVAHVAQTIDWFVEGAFRPQGFSMDFEAMDGAARKISSLSEARAWLDRSVAGAVETINSKSMEEMNQPLPEGPIMGGMPRFAIVEAVADHTAHHRGALTVYARMCGKTPAMPYLD